MKLKILHFFLLFAATTAKDVYVEGATTDSPGAEAVVPAAKLGVNETLAASHRRMNRLGFPGLKKCAVAPSGTEPCWELADPGMTDIPEDFLRGNKDLTGTLKLGAAVKTIGGYAFIGTKLTGLDISDAASLVSIGIYAFGFTGITGTLVIPAKVETIRRGAFAYSYGITGLDLSNATSLESIGNEAFAETNLEGTLVIPANVETIGYYAFGNTNLEGTLVIPANVETIGDAAFSYSYGITGLDLSNATSLVSIGVVAFSDTDIQGTLVIPAKVKIGWGAFPAGVTIVKG